MMMKKFLMLALAIAVGSGVAGAQSKLTKAQADKGKPIYEKHCSGCHGMKGKADGPAGDRLRPRPRNFRIARYKFTYTKFGKMPQDSTLFERIAKGLPGSSMPGWDDVLTEERIWNVVAYIKSLSKKFARAERKKKFPKPIEIGQPPEWTQDDIREGHAIFKKSCEKCHGADARGSGPSAVGLKHDLGDRIWPRDLTKGWTFRGGNRPEDIYRTVATGISGTPMPQHLDSLKPEQIWKVVGFVGSITRRDRPEIAEVIVSRFIDGAMPTDPVDKRWQSVDSSYIPLVSQIIEGQRWFTTTLESVEVRSFYNKDKIAILVEWDDPTASPLPKPNEVFPENEPDAVAIQLPIEIPTGMEKPYFLGGSEKTPVTLWKWTNGAGAVSLRGKGILKTEKVPDKSQVTNAKAIYVNGRWKAVFTRSLKAPPDGGLTFEPGKYIPIAFNAWDGNNAEKDEKRAISIWYWLLLEPPADMTVYLWPMFIGLLIVGAEFWLSAKAKNNE